MSTSVSDPKSTTVVIGASLSISPLVHRPSHHNGLSRAYDHYLSSFLRVVDKLVSSPIEFTSIRGGVYRALFFSGSEEELSLGPHSIDAGVLVKAPYDSPLGRKFNEYNEFVAEQPSRDPIELEVAADPVLAGLQRGLSDGLRASGFKLNIAVQKIGTTHRDCLRLL